jgi:CheY-like chemotaxis protein
VDRVLIVEDSPDQARMIAALLESGDYATEVARDGVTALRVIEERTPDVVVTDLIMPGINGLQVVEAVRRRHPRLPVILMTAFGSGEIAARALRQGAASYVPKRSLREELLRTVESTLRVARAETARARGVECLDETEYRFVLQNDEALIPPLVAFVQDAIRRHGERLDDNQLIQVGIALQEALLNAMHHGNLEVDSAVRESGSEHYERMVAGRRADPHYGSRRVHFSARISADRLDCVIRDEGPGFDPSQVPDPTNPANLERVSGRGLYLIWTFMDRVVHNATGNQITLVKRLTGGGAA